jgi:hypothetical protein
MNSRFISASLHRDRRQTLSQIPPGSQARLEATVHPPYANYLRAASEREGMDRRRLVRARSPSAEELEPVLSASVALVRPDELERRLQERLNALGLAPRAELLHVLTLPDFERADRIGEFWSYPQSRAFAELLIDCEEDRTLRAVLVGMLREA